MTTIHKNHHEPIIICNSLSLSGIEQATCRGVGARPAPLNLGRHVRFARDHHRKVRRIALAADSALASLVPVVGKHFVQAEVRRFGYDELAAAVEWAGNSGALRATG